MYTHECFVCFSQLPEQYRLMHIQPPKKKSKHKHKHHRPQDPLPQGKLYVQYKQTQRNVTCFQTTDLLFLDNTETPSDSDPKKKKKKRDDDPDRKKKKKDKKKKKVSSSIKTSVIQLCGIIITNAVMGRDGRDPYTNLNRTKLILEHYYLKG